MGNTTRKRRWLIGTLFVGMLALATGADALLAFRGLAGLTQLELSVPGMAASQASYTAPEPKQLEIEVFAQFPTTVTPANLVASGYIGTQRVESAERYSGYTELGATKPITILRATTPAQRSPAIMTVRSTDGLRFICRRIMQDSQTHHAVYAAVGAWIWPLHERENDGYPTWKPNSTASCDFAFRTILRERTQGKVDSNGRITWLN